MKKYLIVFLLLISSISALASSGYKIEPAKVYDSSYYDNEYYALVICKHGLLIGIVTPRLFERGEEILLKYRNTKEGIEHIFYKEVN